jgi:hypothetical protein
VAELARDLSVRERSSADVVSEDSGGVVLVLDGCFQELRVAVNRVPHRAKHHGEHGKPPPKSHVDGANHAGSTLNRFELSDSTNVAPGTALVDKATAIQAAVNAGQAAAACADITDYLGLVKAQTGKKLTDGTPAMLSADANNLALAFGC